LKGNGINFSNSVNFNSYVNFNYDVSFSTTDGYTAKAKLKTQKNSYGYQAAIYLYSKEQYDTFEVCTEPVQSLYISFYGGNHIVQFKVMTQEELNNYRLQRF
jgi:hypothetical protein